MTSQILFANNHKRCLFLVSTVLLLLSSIFFFVSAAQPTRATTAQRTRLPLDANKRELMNRFFSSKQELKDASQILAGASKINATMPIGTPLAGYNHGKRRVPRWPLPHFGPYTTFMMPSVGFRMPMYAKCLSLLDVKSSVPLLVVAIDAVGSDGTLLKLAYDKAVSKSKKNGQAFTVPLDNVIMGASHSHSGPGAITPDLLWALAPATDLLVPQLQDQMANFIADCMVESFSTMKPALVGVGTSDLKTVTDNRRAKISPYVTPKTIDPQLGIIRVDDAVSGAPIATLWNFAIHGICYGPDNMEFSGDIMGRANQLIEEKIPGSVSLFINADAGDIDPTGDACHGAPDFYGSHVIADAVQMTRSQVKTSNNMDLTVYSEVMEFGKTNLNLTFARAANCTHGGFLHICTICNYMNCDANLHLDSKWIDNTPRFTGVRMNIGGQNIVIVTSPGENLVQLGNQVREDAKKLGSDLTLLFGYSNTHMGYFATSNEYEIGGYESLLTLWGEFTANKIRESSYKVMQKVTSVGK